jgi:ribosomal protein L3 glutamine methyltransferase
MRGLSPRMTHFRVAGTKARLTDDTIDKLAHELITLRDLLRYAVSRFGAARLSYGHGTTNALDEAVFLLLESLHLPINDINPFADARLTFAERKLLLQRIDKRISTRKPAAYIVNRAYIGGIPFYVDERVIVPRSYIGELLLSGRLGSDGLGLTAEPQNIESILDLCTGSGCLAVIAAKVFPTAQVHAADLSADALEVARVNIAESGTEHSIELFHGDLFKPIKANRYDLILANPPYVDRDAMAALPKEYRCEPTISLAGGSDGLDIVRKILEQAKRHLTSRGMLVCEIGRGRAILERDYPEIDFFWLDTEESSGEVFCLAAASLS